jgi:curved DNA-binding protein CbpA
MDPFEILGVARDASDDDISKAFKRLAREHHPDHNPGDADAAARFRRIKGAYDAIRSMRVHEAERRRADEARRARQARHGEEPRRASEARDGPRGARRSAKGPTPLDDVEARLQRLVAAIDRACESPTVTRQKLDAVLDAARWSRLHVDLALAFKPQVHPLRDRAWSMARYTAERDARELVAAFRETVLRLDVSRIDHVELRNLRARLDGLLAVAEGWRRALAPS